MQGTIDGENGDHILIAPPFIINEMRLMKFLKNSKSLLILFVTFDLMNLNITLTLNRK